MLTNTKEMGFIGGKVMKVSIWCLCDFNVIYTCKGVTCRFTGHFEGSQFAFNTFEFLRMHNNFSMLQ